MALVMLLVVVLLAQVGGYGLPTPGFGRATKAPTMLAATASATATQTPTATLAATDGLQSVGPTTTTQATAGPVALTRANRPSTPYPLAPSPYPLSPGPTAAATPIITLAR